MTNIKTLAYKEGTKDYIPVATSQQVERLKKDGIDFGDTTIYIDNFNFLRNFLQEENQINTEELKKLLETEKKPLVIKKGTKHEINEGETQRYATENYIWSAEDCCGGWFIVIAKRN